MNCEDVEDEVEFGGIFVPDILLSMWENINVDGAGGGFRRFGNARVGARLVMVPLDGGAFARRR